MSNAIFLDFSCSRLSIMGFLPDIFFLTDDGTVMSDPLGINMRSNSNLFGSRDALILVSPP